MEMLKASLSLVPWIASKVAKHVAYPFKVSSNIRTLESSLEQLDAQKKDFENTVAIAERQNCTPTEQFKLWLEDVASIEEKAEKNHKKYHQLSRCIWNISPNLWLNYKVSKRAAEQNAEVMNLCERGAKFPAVRHRASPLAEEMPVPVSNSSNLELAHHLIMDDANNIIGIWGMGGVGKTHLLKQINNKIYKDSTFSVVMFVTCTQESSEEKIQNEIINKFGLNKSNSMEERRRTIFSFLNPMNFVLLLDDLWSRMDLDSVGIPNPYGIVGDYKRKIVLTTRSEDVCGLMEVDRKMRVNVLDWNEAWSLFKGKVSEQTIESHPLILKYAVDVVKKLGGLPLALITVGRAMHDKTDPRKWEHAVELLERARLHEVELSDRDNSVFKLLKFSYDNLKNKKYLRECFLHCSLWPQDHPIEKNDLVELWMGLGLIDENDIHMAYNVGYDYIGRLQSVCLLESIDNESQVKLHHVIRDMSLWIVSEKGKRKNKWIVRSRASNQSRVIIDKETEKMSFMYHHADKVSFIPSCKDTRLSTFLFTWSSLSSIPVLRPFSHLTVLNLKQNEITVFPTEICGMLNLQFVDLSGNNIKSLPLEIAALCNLKYLYLKWNPIRTIPEEAIYQMRALKVLDLSPCHHFFKLNFLQSLLETLERLPEFGALGIVLDNRKDMIRLSKSYVPVRWLTITMWEGNSFSFLFNPRKLFSLRLIKMEVDSVNFIEFERLEHLEICKIPMYKLDPPKSYFPFLKCITISLCYRLLNISWVVHLPCLRELTVSGCKSLICLILECDPNEPTFPLLKLLVLEELPELETIGAPEIIFPTLETLKIFGCKKLNFPFKADNIPPKLNHIWVEKKWWNSKLSQDSLKSSLIEYVKFLY
ncbi:LRR and NB-ARC domains-containing disease resistance protein [Rhynchospora pubera]|uniref:LRR and NB-ARC domains-containing disease resistance protein n=1 Tax=Rhynchospora pubera TaxID=906938 RepID=A0AAV8H6Z6_9POAL|nr:LRR and NB-ARC domains-containing disease resistance protein [Rhynchospora pubera]